MPQETASTMPQDIRQVCPETIHLAVLLHPAEQALHDVPPPVRVPVVVPWVRAVAFGWYDRPQPERPRQQAGRVALVRAVHEQVRAHERAERGHGAAPVGRVVLVARAQVQFDERRLAVGYHVNFGVPSSPGHPDGPEPPFFRGRGGVLVDLHARGVHGEDPDLHGDDPLLLQRREQALDHAVAAPPVETLVDGDPLAEAFGQVPPRRSRPAHPQQGVGHGVVVHDHVAALARQQVRDPHELVQRDVIPRRTHASIIPQRVNTP